ncbi:MAG: four helix bundle protein [bacterium]
MKSKQINKFDRFAAYLKLSNCCLDCLYLTITAALECLPEKIETLSRLRINIELLKHLLRLNYNCHIITQNTYQVWVEQAQGISKETNLWLKNQQSKESGSSNITPDSSQH